jgi:hypothetical protein
MNRKEGTMITVFCIVGIVGLIAHKRHKTRRKTYLEKHQEIENGIIALMVSARRKNG